MATMITSECINCGACEPECPNTAIYQGGVAWQASDGGTHPALSESFFYIVPEKCTECVGFHDKEACAAVCPVDCCVPDPERPETHEVLLARARVLHPELTIGDDAPSRFRTGEAAPQPAGAAPAAPAPPAAAAPGAGAVPPATTAAAVAAAPTAGAGAGAAAAPRAAVAPAPAAMPTAAAPAKVGGRVEKPVAAAAKPPARVGAGPRTFPGELPVEFEQLLGSLGEPRRQPRSLPGRAALMLLAAGQGVLGAMPTEAKARLEAAVGNRRYFSAQLATAANVALNLVLYPSLVVAAAVAAGATSVFSSGVQRWVLLGVAIAVAETVLRFRDGITGRMAPSDMPLRGALYAPLVLPLGVLASRLAGVRGARADVGFDGFYEGREHFDEKRERARRYGEVYRLEDRDEAYLLQLEFPRRVPASSLSDPAPGEMPDYEYELALENGALVVRGHVVDPHVRRLTGAAAAFPSDFTTRVALREPVTGFRHRYRDKTLEVVLPKALAS